MSSAWGQSWSGSWGGSWGSVGSSSSASGLSTHHASMRLRVLRNGVLFSSGSKPANISPKFVGYTVKHGDTERLAIDYKGWLEGDTISSVTWDGSCLTVSEEDTEGSGADALISGVFSTSGRLTVTCTSSGGRTHIIRIRFRPIDVL